jgi:hypothetical protein
LFHKFGSGRKTSQSSKVWAITPSIAPQDEIGVLSLFDHAAHFVLEVYDKHSDNVTELKSAILHVNSNFGNPANRTQSSQPIVQSLRGIGSILPNAFSDLIPERNASRTSFTSSTGGMNQRDTSEA